MRDTTHSTTYPGGRLVVTVPCLDPANCDEHRHLVNCPHEEMGDGEWTCNMPEYLCDYASTGDSEADSASESAAMAVDMAEVTAMAAEAVSAPPRGMRDLFPRRVQGLCVQDTRTGDWGKVCSGIEWASGMTVVRIQLIPSDLTYWVPTSVLRLI